MGNGKTDTSGGGSASAPLTITTSTLPAGQVGTGYSTTLQSNGGQTPVQWAVTAGNLPPGLTLATAGSISGTASTSGTYTFTAQAADASTQKVTRQFNLTVTTATLAITTTSLPNATLNAAYNFQIQTSGSTGAVTFAVSAGSLPTGLTLSSSGLISGTATSLSSSTVTISATDTSPQTVSRQFQLAVTPPALSITTSGLPAGPVSVAYSTTLNASGGVTPYTWSLSAGALAAGLTLASSGTISGTPTTPGTSTFTVTLNDSAGQSQGRQFSITVNPTPLMITTTALPNGVSGVAYNTQVLTSGGFGAIAVALASGSLPTGLSIATDGTIAGTPTSVGDFNFVVSASDTAGQVVTRSLSIHIASSSLMITTMGLPAGSVGVAYSASVAASGGVAPYTWSLFSGSLPAGLSLDSAGNIAGTPTAGGTAMFTVQVSDSSAQTQTKPLSLTINASTVDVSPLAVSDATQNVVYNATITASGGTGPFTFTVLSGALPTGLTLSSGGALSGTPTTLGSFSFVIQATDSLSQTGSRAYSITVNPSPLQITTASLLGGTVSQSYTSTLASTGGTLPVTWSVSAGTLPAGLTLSSAGTLSGTPTASGSSTFTIKVTDAAAQTATHQYSVTINPAPLVLSTTSLPNVQSGSAYSTTLASTGGTNPYSYSIISGALPTGITLSSSGVISGTTSSFGTFNATIRVADSGSQTAQRAFSLSVQAPPLSITTVALPDTVQGQAYSQTISASGGAPPLTWSISAGGLPTGLSLSSSGAITGTSSAVGSFTFTAQVVDSATQVATRQFTINVAPTALSLDTTSLPPATLNAPFSATLAASGGVAPYSWSIVSGALPAGVTLTSGGLISGTPTATGTFNITVRVQDNSAQSAQRALSLVVQAPPLLINTNTLANGNAGSPYSFTMTATGGIPPYTWSIAGGTLPAGISFSTAGVFSGTPTTNASYPLTIRVTDSVGTSATKALTLNITPAFRFTITSIWGGIVGQPYSFTFQTADAPGAVSFAVTSGTIPPGTTFSTSTGVLSGTPTTAGTFTFTVQATSAGQTITFSGYMMISPGDTLYGTTAGNVYADEGGAPDPAAILVSACGVLGTGPYRLTKSISAATPSSTCLTLSDRTRLDLNGFTVTGRVQTNGVLAKASVFNGTINCVWVDNGGDVGCLLLVGYPTQDGTLRVHHLTISNTGQLGRAMHIDWLGGAPATSITISVHHMSITVPTQPTAARSYAISILGGNNRVEAYSNDLTCQSDARACQAIMCYGTVDCKLHHNRINMQQSATDEPGRALLFDGGVLNGESWNNDVQVHDNRAVRVRDSSNIRIHDNQFRVITCCQTIGSIHLADPDGTAVDDLNVLVDNNNFENSGGLVFFIRSGINAFVRNNHVTCVGCGGGLFASVRNAFTTTQITFSDNQDVILNLPSPQIFVEGPNGQATICNSGTGFGGGTIIPIFTTPCP